MSYSDLTLSSLRGKMGNLKKLVVAHDTLIFMCITQPIRTAIIDLDLFNTVDSISPTDNSLEAPPFFLKDDAGTYLFGIQQKDAELDVWITDHLGIDYKEADYRNPQTLEPYVKRMEDEILSTLRADLDEMLGWFEKIKYHEAKQLREKLHIRLYREGSFDEVMELVPILIGLKERKKV
jgi:hypothetical protein